MSLNTTIFGQALAFLLFVLFCMKYVWPPLIQVLETRQKEIADSLHAAELGKSQLRLAQIEADKLIQKAKQDARAWMEQAELQRSEFLENARKEAQSLRKELLGQLAVELDSERKRNQAEMLKEVGDLVVLGMQRILPQVVGEKTHEALVEEFIASLQQEDQVRQLHGES